jgi:hypothetical protein
VVCICEVHDAGSASVFVSPFDRALSIGIVPDLVDAHLTELRAEDGEVLPRPA